MGITTNKQPIKPPPVVTGTIYMKRIHVINHTGPVSNPLLTNNRETFNPGDTLVINLPDNLQQSYRIEFVAREKIKKGWCYLLLEDAHAVTILADKPEPGLSSGITG